MAQGDSYSSQTTLKQRLICPQGLAVGQGYELKSLGSEPNPWGNWITHRASIDVAPLTAAKKHLH